MGARHSDGGTNSSGKYQRRRKNISVINYNNATFNMNIDHAQEHPGMMTFNNSSIASLGSINGATELLREMKNDSGGA